ncbi:HU family DNA-binding protein [Methylotenera sp. G11]|uniref:HU family DNA-binding protein n=1 Tax=Methylotenera sp. G11 TaxID=1506585 RepID=UPI000689F04C|nr:HU family DNA-binding protein [Methylotenera sp. G11]
MHDHKPQHAAQETTFMHQLIAKLAARFPDLTEKDVLLSAEIIIEAMSARLIGGGRIELRGFGTFRLNIKPGAAGGNLAANMSPRPSSSPEVIFKPSQTICEMADHQG